MKALLTGHKGFVGRHLQRELLARGYEVVGIDLLDGDDCLDFFRSFDYPFDLAIHCAAIVGGRTTIDGSPLAIATNMALDSLYFRWLLRSGTRQAVYFSSSAAYPVGFQRPGALPLTENLVNTRAISEPDATYGLAKVIGERLAEEVAQDIDLLVVRPFSGYGEDQALDYPFPSFIDRAVRRDDPFEIWGDGTQTRDFIHVDDVIAATFELLEQGARMPVNLGTGFATSFNDLAVMVCEQRGYEPELKHLKAAPTGVHTRVANIERLHEFYVPKVTLEEGIARALAARLS